MTDKSVKVVNVNCATRIVVNADLESFLTVSEVQGIYSLASANENMNDDGTKVGPSLTRNTPGMSLYANVTDVPSRKALNFCRLFTPEGNRADVVVLMEFIRAITKRFANTAYGRSSYARALIEVQADVDLKDNSMVAMPKLVGKGFIRVLFVLSMSENLLDIVKNMKKLNQVTRCVPVGPKVRFKSSKQVYRHVSKKNNVNTSGNKKKNVEPTIKVDSYLENLFEFLKGCIE
nr:hypothetical protein [Tanacetum cinerariifolium]